MPKIRAEITNYMEPGHVPVAAKCSQFGDPLPLTDQVSNSAEEQKKHILAAMNKHIRDKHSSEDVNQAAARIVREATQD